jgi:hypothetical protein
MTKFDKIWKWLFTPYETKSEKKVRILLSNIDWKLKFLQ